MDALKPITLNEEAMAVRLAALARDATVARGREMDRGKTRYPLDQILRDEHQARALHAAADRLERMAKAQAAFSAPARESA